MMAPASKQKFEEQKNFLIDTTILAASLLGLALVLISLISTGMAAHMIDLVTDIASIALIFGVYFARNKITLKLKAYFVIAILYAVVILDQLQYGLSAIDSILIILIPFLSILVLSPLVTVILAAATLGSYLIVGLLIATGVIETVYQLTSTDLSIISWIDSTFMIGIVSFAVTSFVHRFNKTLYISYTELDNQYRLLSDRDTLLTRITNSIPRTYIKVIDANMNIVFAGGQAFYDSNVDPKSIIGLPIKTLFEDQEKEVSDSFIQAYESTFKGISATTETILNGHFILLKTIPLRNADGNVESVLSVAEDITEIANTEKLLKENLDEKNVLLQEIHHRVKNNLAVVSGLLELQSYHTSSPELQYILRKSTNRIMSIAKVHQMLYESNNFTRLPFKKYINELVNIILSSMNFEHQDVEVKTNIEVQNININHGVPLGIIFNELITNSLKYGFSTNTRNLITISVYEDDGLIQVIFEDNGVGISNFEEASSKSLGFKLIASLLKQIEADYHYDTQSQFKLSFSFPSNIQHSDFPIG